MIISLSTLWIFLILQLPQNKKNSRAAEYDSDEENNDFQEPGNDLIFNILLFNFCHITADNLSTGFSLHTDTALTDAADQEEEPLDDAGNPAGISRNIYAQK